MKKSDKSFVKEQLVDALKKEGAYWSYDTSGISASTMSDARLIADVMRYLDLPEIKQLFTIYSFRKIKQAWIRLLIPEGDYLRTLNRFFAWFYFGIKYPDRYLKSMETRHLNSLLQ